MAKVVKFAVGVLAVLASVYALMPSGAQAGAPLPPAGAPRIEERLRAQQAMDRVYYGHRIWPKENPAPRPPFEEIAPGVDFKGEVVDPLLKSAALERYFKSPITGEQLQAEMDRMARESQAPDRLRELFAALGNQPALIAECLVRPILADRLLREKYAADGRLHGEARQEAEELLEKLTAGNFQALGGGRYRAVKIARAWGGEAAPSDSPDTLRLGDEAFLRAVTEFPSTGQVSPLLETADGFAILTTQYRDDALLVGGAILFPKRSFDAWWAEVSPELSPEQDFATGTVYTLPQIKGKDAPLAGDGWVPTASFVPRPADRFAHSCLWTGAEMVLWGGSAGALFDLAAGASYDPATDNWTPLPTAASPAPRRGHTAVWTGKEMIVWGGNLPSTSRSVTNTGGRFSPLARAWTPTSTAAPCPAGSYGHSAHWSGTEMAVRGGMPADENAKSTSGRYDPSTDTWKAGAGDEPLFVTRTVGAGGDYATLKAAFDAINAGTDTGTILLDLVSDTTETASCVLNASGSGAASYTSVLVRPSGGAPRTVSGAITAGSPLIDLNGADNVTFDGLNAGGNALTISNTTASATSGTCTIRFIGGATANTVTNCTVLGSFGAAVATNGGTIYFATDAVTANGNDNNTISNNTIGPAGTNLPTKGIYGNGTTTNAAIGNNGIVIDNNNIYDYFGAAVASAGVYVGGGCSGWTITNNRFYQTGTRTWTTGANNRAIDIQNSTATTGAQGFTITGNTIGYASAAGTGTYALTGSTGKFAGIVFNGLSAGTASSISNNTITAVSLTGVTSSGTGTSSPFMAILVTNGVANTNGNTIGSQNATGSLTFSTNTTTSTDVYGIYNFSVDNWTANGNSLGGISVNNAGTSGAFIFFGMRANTGSSVSFNAGSNNVGGAVANSIQSNSTSTTAQIVGIASTNAICNFTSNTVRNMTAAGGTGTSAFASVIGILNTGTGVGALISQNTIYALGNSNTSSATTVCGIQYTGATTGTNVVARNRICGLTTASNSTAAVVNGINVSGGTTVYRNNMIVLGDGIANAIGTGSTAGVSGISEPLGTDSFFHNSVYIGGNPTAGVGPSYAFNSSQTVNTRSFRDNIFFNARNNSGATGKNYAVRVGGTAPNPTGLTINNNVYYANGSGAVFGYFNSLDVANLAAWRTAVGQDAGSFESNPQYLDPTNAVPDLHINPVVSTVIEGNGADVGVADDFDGQARAGLTPVDIGADAGNFIGIDLTGPAIGYAALGNSTSTANRAFAGVTITDASGVDTAAGTRPRVYYKRSTDGNTWNDNTSGTDGWKYVEANGGASPFDFTLDYALLNGGTGVSSGTVVQYFVVAQDLATTPNVGINSGAFAAPQISVALTGAAFPIGGSVNSYTIVAPISGTKTVCASGCDYASLTNAGGVFADINGKVVTGNIAVQITGDLTAETGAIALNAISEEPAGSNFTITIQPSGGGGRTVSGAFASGALIKLNGADRVTIDGLNTGGNSLAITNTSTTAPTAISVASLGVGLGATDDTIKNCSISTGVSAAAGYGISVGGATPGTPGADNDNATLQGNTITVATNGIYAYGTASTSTGGLDNLTLSGNSITSNTTIQNYGIQVGNALNSTISQNTVSVTTSASGQPVAISLETGFVSSSVSRNKVTSALTTATGGYGGRGITVGTGSTTSALTIANNVVYGVNGSNYSGFGNSSSMGIAIGVIGASGTLTTTAGGINLYYNSVNMAGSYSYAAACLTTALYVGSGASALDLRDNVFVNSLNNINASGGTSKNYAIYSAAANTAYATVNYDDYFVSGTQGVLGFLTSDRTDLAGIQAAFGQNLNSIAANPLFNTATNLQPQTGSPVVGAGTPVSVTTDITGATRSGTAPTIGAYESAADTVGPTIAYTALGNTTSTSNRTLSLTATDPSGVPTVGIGLPVLYYRKGASGAFSAAQCVSTGGGGYDGTFDYSVLGGVVAGDTIQYYVAAQDNLGNVSANPSAGAAGFTANPPAAATPPTTPSSYLISYALSGTYNVGSAETHTSLTNPGGIFEFINANVLAGNVTVEITSDLTAETGAVALNQWVEEGAGGYTVLIRPSGAPRAITGTSTAVSLIKLNGADRVTIDGSTSGGTDRSLTITNNLATGPNAVIWIGSASASNGATGNTLKNMVLSGSGTATTTVGIVAGSGTTLGSPAEAPNSNNAILNNRVIKAQNAAYLFGAPGMDQNWIVAGNTFGSAVASEKLSYRGMLFANAQNATVAGNTILGVTSSATSTATMSGIQVAGTISGGSVVRNSISDIKQVNTAGYGSNGVLLGASSTASDLTVANNMIYDVASYGYAGVTAADNGYGIIVIGGGGYKLYHNSVRMTTNQTALNGITAAINIATGLGAGAVDLRNNIFANTQTVGTRYAIYCASASTVFSNIDYNDYDPGTGTLGYLGAAQATIAAWRTATGQDAASISADPLFVSATDLHLAPCPPVSPAVGAGTPLAAVTVDYDGDTRSATNPDMGADEAPRPVPAAPAAPTFSSITRTTLTVDWTSVAGAASYDVWRATGATCAGAVKITAAPVAGTSFGDSLLTCNTQYSYFITANGACGASADGACGTTTTAACTAPPPEVAPGVTVETAQTWADATTMTWPSEGTATSYTLYRGTSADLPQLLDGSTDSCTRYAGTATSDATLTEDPTAIPGGFYWYLVTGTNGDGEGTAGPATAGPRVVNSSGACP